MNTNEHELISLAEACKLIPSPRAGKRTHIATLHRWVVSGRLPAVRRGRWYFVRRSDLESLTREYVVVPKRPLPKIATERQMAERIRKMNEELAKSW